MERQLRTPKQETKTPPGNLSVEHVMPQKWEANWPLPSDVSGANSAPTLAERNHLLHTFGNLTLVTQPLNSALSNGAFAAKKTEITTKSLLSLNAFFQPLAQWDEAAILKRGKHFWGLPRRSGLTPASRRSLRKMECLRLHSRNQLSGEVIYPGR